MSEEEEEAGEEEEAEEDEEGAQEEGEEEVDQEDGEEEEAGEHEEGEEGEEETEEATPAEEGEGEGEQDPASAASPSAAASPKAAARSAAAPKGKGADVGAEEAHQDGVTGEEAAEIAPEEAEEEVEESPVDDDSIGDPDDPKYAWRSDVLDAFTCWRGDRGSVRPQEVSRPLRLLGFAPMQKQLTDFWAQFPEMPKEVSGKQFIALCESLDWEDPREDQLVSLFAHFDPQSTDRVPRSVFFNVMGSLEEALTPQELALALDEVQVWTGRSTQEYVNYRDYIDWASGR